MYAITSPLRSQSAAPSEPKVRLFAEAMGLRPWRERWAQALVAIRGQEDVPPSQFDLSSLKQLKPRIALRLWRGRFFTPRRAIVTNLFNHRQTPIEQGWSVKKTQVLDFRGRDLTYDSHNGTDFAIPIGTPVLAAAPGKVIRVVSEFNRGGLKIFIDHGHGLMTTSAHLARALVREGQVVTRGETIALSGYSGLDALVTFPFGAPHVHFNTWLNGEPVDPFPHQGEASLWRAGASPKPMTASLDEAFIPSVYSEAGTAAAIKACKTASSRSVLEAIEPLAVRAGRTVIEMNYYPTRFRERPSPYAGREPRTARLDLPFAASTFDGIVFADDL